MPRSCARCLDSPEAATSLRPPRGGAIFGFEKCAILFLKIKLRAILYDSLLTRTRHAHRLEETSPRGSVPARRGTCALSSSDASDRRAPAVDQGAT
jgi:hypothetical protein